MPEKNSVIVVGGGWAGLSCAVELAYTGHHVTLLEAARQLGGRARRVPFNELKVDNGQHLLVGAYRETLALLRRLNVDIKSHLETRKLDFIIQDKIQHSFRLSLPRLFNPLNLSIGLLGAKGFSLKDRWRALRFGMRLFTNSIYLDEDISVVQLLKAEKQTANNIDALWEPICLASLNTPIDEASARVFIRVLRDTFCRSAYDSDILIPKTDLSSLLPDPAFDFIEQHGGNIQLSKRVTKLNIEQRHIIGVSCDGQELTAEHVVLALPPYACQELVKDHPALHDVAYNMSGYSYNPICTIYLRYPDSVRPDYPVQAFLGGVSQWLIDRHTAGQAGLLAMVISGPGPHMQMDNETLAQQVQVELQEHYPHWPRPDDVMVIREKRATFNCRAGIDLLRPENATVIKGLWFAGDFTNTGYPATLEGAVHSGLRTARLIHDEVTGH